MKLAIVTASTDPFRARDCIASWTAHAVTKTIPYILENGTGNPYYGHYGYLGTVPAFKLAVQHMLDETDAEIIACLHDDFRIDESRWYEKVIRHFERHPACGLLGFGGAKGLGSDRLYLDPYDPMQLARIGFRSNLVEAEAHGMRSLLPERVACLDGFSQVGRREFWEGLNNVLGKEPRPWNVLADLGMVHHFYDGALGCLAKRQGWDVWYVPLRGHHFGGQTAVGDRGYNEWAKTQIAEGDHGFWEAAHRAGYEAFRDVLPLRA